MNYAILSNNAIATHGPASVLWPRTSFPPSGPNDSFLAGAGAVRIRSDVPCDADVARLEVVTPYLRKGQVYDRRAVPLEAKPGPPVTGGKKAK